MGLQGTDDEANFVKVCGMREKATEIPGSFIFCKIIN
jgi:hypothetical protein